MGQIKQLYIDQQNQADEDATVIPDGHGTTFGEWKEMMPGLVTERSRLDSIYKHLSQKVAQASPSWSATAGTPDPAPKQRRPRM